MTAAKHSVVLDVGTKDERRVDMTTAEFIAWSKAKAAEARAIFAASVARA